MVGPDGYLLLQKGPALQNTAHRKQHPGIFEIHQGSPDDDCNSAGNARLEVKYADATSPWSTFVSLGNTAGLLQAVHHAKEYGLANQLRKLPLLKSPTYAIWDGLPFTQLHRTLETIEGHSVSALDVQEANLLLLHELHQRAGLAPDTALSIYESLRTIDKLRGVHNVADISSISNRIGWAGRLSEMARRYGEHITSGNVRAVAFDLNWDRINPPGPGDEYWQSQSKPLVNPQDIERCVHTPPPYSRAEERARHVRSLPPTDPAYDHQVRWNAAGMTRFDNPYGRYAACMNGEHLPPRLRQLAQSAS